MSYYAIKRDDKLTSQLKIIFGDLVVDSFVADRIYDDQESIRDEVKRNQLLNMMQQSDELSNGEWVQFPDSSDVIVMFSNGKKIIFSNSEWLSLSELNIETKEL